jgi:hypothetical protein
LGFGRVIVSLANITTTVDMVGLSAASSWTHNRPMFMHLTTSLSIQVFASTECIVSKQFPSHHFFHVCKLLWTLLSSELKLLYKFLIR